MNELNFLRKMWEDVPRFTKAGEPKKRIDIRRQIKLIVPRVSYENSQGSFHNEHWVYVVPFSFREALDIQYDKRQKTRLSVAGKKETVFYAVWTQGCLLNLLAGDMFHSVSGKPCLQIKEAVPMSWDSVNGIMTEGCVTYEYFFEKGVVDPVTVTQLDFLRVLIYGESSMDGQRG